MQIRPLHDRVIVKRLEEERKTASGIVIPDSAAEKPDQGEIVAVGKGKVGKGGVVRSSAEHVRVIDEIKEAATGLGFTTQEVTESPLLGPKGNKEFLIHLTDPNSRI